MDYQSSGKDYIDAGAGNDTVTGRDQIVGGEGNDTIYADFQNVSSNPGNDVVDAGAGNDTVFGGDGDDKIAGGDGNDALMFEVNRNEYQITQNADRSFTIVDTVADRDGTEVRSETVKGARRDVDVKLGSYGRNALM